MDRNKIIILALIVIIAALLVGIATTTMPNANKKDTNVTYKGKSKITEGDTINLKLTDVNGTPLANQTVNVTVTDKDKSNSYYSVVTNAKGIGKVNSDKSAGNYTVFINYEGNEIYNACNFTKRIVIEDKVVEAEVISSSQSSSDYDIDNLPPTNDPYPETNRYYIDEDHVKQEYADGYMRTVDVNTGEIHSLGFR